jgi:GxxExxY protein
MPIRTAVPIEVFDQERFHDVDQRVTGLAFAIHNEFGRYLDERLYQRELTRRCRDIGLAVEAEMRIVVSLDDFRKDYYVDHLVNQGVVVENKAVTALSPAHIGQALNYLFLCGLQHGTLLNFRMARVQHQFVSTGLTPEKRRRYSVTTEGWMPFAPMCGRMLELLKQLLAEWGAYLDPILYRDALTHFLGGEQQILRDVAIQSSGELIGTQKMHLLTDDVAFSVTASTHRPGAVCEHQRRFLRHAPLRAVQWINLNHDRIELRTIQ